MSSLARMIASFVALCGPVVAQSMIPPVTGFTSVDYVSPQWSTGHDHQRFALFQPSCPQPLGGYPVVIHVANSGLSSTNTCYDASITGEDSPFRAFLDSGFAVVQAALTSTDPEDGEHDCHAYPTYDGKGIFHPPGVTLSGLTQAPYTDPSKPMAEKDVVMLIQHVRYNAASFGIDPTRIALWGRSGGAVVSMWCAFGPERGPGLFAMGSGQDLVSSRPNAAILSIGAVYFPALVNTTQLNHFPMGHTGPAWTTPTSTLAQAVTGFPQLASAVDYEDSTLNAAQTVMMFYGPSYESTAFDPPYITNTLIDVHSSWSGYVWKKLHPQTILYATRDAAYIPSSGALLEKDAGKLIQRQIEYLRAEMNAPSSVVDEGLGLPSNPGGDEAFTPVLTACPMANGGLTLGLSAAAKSSLCYVVAGESLSPVEIVSGGWLGPSVDHYVTTTTDRFGGHTETVPASYLPSGVPRYFQCWIVEVVGSSLVLTASNTIEYTAP